MRRWFLLARLDLIITAIDCATTYIPFIKTLYNTFKIPLPTITQTLQNINTLAIHHAMLILLHKRQLKNNQPLPHTQILP
jgi:hypothetical protein